MSITVMKQALEALDCIYSPLHVREINKVGAAMKVLRQAIEQAEKVEPVACPYCHAPATLGAVYFDQNCEGCVKRMAPTAPAQPLNDFDMRGVLASRLLCWHRLTEAEAQDLICFFEGVRRPAPAQQPLSILQIERIYDEVPEFQPDGSWWIVALARAIEQAHGIKGASL